MAQCPMSGNITLHHVTQAGQPIHGHQTIYATTSPFTSCKLIPRVQPP